MKNKIERWSWFDQKTDDLKYGLKRIKLEINNIKEFFPFLKIIFKLKNSKKNIIHPDIKVLNLKSSISDIKKLYLWIIKNNGVLEDSYSKLVNASNNELFLNKSKLLHSCSYKSIFPPPALSSFK